MKEHLIDVACSPYTLENLVGSYWENDGLVMVLDNKDFPEFLPLLRVTYYFTWNPRGVAVDIVVGDDTLHLIMLKEELTGEKLKSLLTSFLTDVLTMYQLQQQYRNMTSLMAVEGDLFAAGYSGPLEGCI